MKKTKETIAVVRLAKSLHDLMAKMDAIHKCLRNISTTQSMIQMRFAPDVDRDVNRIQQMVQVGMQSVNDAYDRKHGKGAAVRDLRAHFTRQMRDWLKRCRN